MTQEASADNVATVRSLFEAFNENDLDRAAATVTDDFELTDHAAGWSFRGPDGLREWLQTCRRAMPDAHAEVTAAVAQGDRVATEHTRRGTHTGPLMTPAGELPPTGRFAEIAVADLFELRDGRIARLRSYYDGASVMRQLGVLPPRAAVVARILLHQARRAGAATRTRR